MVKFKFPLKILFIRHHCRLYILPLVLLTFTYLTTSPFKFLKVNNVHDYTSPTVMSHTHTHPPTAPTDTYTLQQSRQDPHTPTVTSGHPPPNCNSHIRMNMTHTHPNCNSLIRMNTLRCLLIGSTIFSVLVGACIWWVLILAISIFYIDIINSFRIASY